MRSVSSFFALAAVVPTLVVGQLSGSVGPLTTIAEKTATKTCDITDYGAVADGTTDISDAITSAFAACKTGGVVVVPSGDYALETWVALSGGSTWALQLDGVIYRTGTEGGNMIMIEHSDDFELFSSTSSGAIQGNGYEFHKDGDTSGPRILRFYEVTNFSAHDIILVDSPLFHFSLDTCENGEVYNMAIRGANMGGLDGIDVWSTNIWIHDVMVTNKDECVTVKSPATNILIEQVYCNWSGGSCMGSLGADTDISTITYNNVYTWSSNNMMMIKSNGGSGTVDNIVFENFIGHGNAYSLDIDQYWSSMSAVDGDGVQLSNIKIANWTGTEEDGLERGPIRIRCADTAPCTGIEITDFAMWTEEGDSQWYSCESAYGSGFCLKDGTDYTSYTSTTTVTAAPTGYSAATMAEDLTTDFGTTASIPIPTLPASFFPGLAPISAFASAESSVNKVALSSSSATAAASTSKKTSAAVVASSSATAAASSSKKTSTAVVASSTAVATSSVVVVSSSDVVVSSSAISSATTLQTAVASTSKVRTVSSSASASSASDKVVFDTTSSIPTATATASLLSSAPASSSSPSAPAFGGSEGSSTEVGAESGEDDSDCEVVYVEA